MGLPRQLKNMNLFVEGQSYMGEVESVTRAKLTRKMEAFRAAGMPGAAHLDMGLEDDALKVEWTVGGYAEQAIKQLGMTRIDGVGLRFAGAYQRDNNGAVDAVEVIMRGRHQEVDPGEAKVGDKTSTKITTNCTYYKESINGRVLVEIDVLNMIHIVDGKDILKEQRKAIGL